MGASTRGSSVLLVLLLKDGSPPDAVRSLSFRPPLRPPDFLHLMDGCVAFILVETTHLEAEEGVKVEEEEEEENICHSVAVIDLHCHQLKSD